MDTGRSALHYAEEVEEKLTSPTSKHYSSSVQSSSGSMNESFEKGMFEGNPTHLKQSAVEGENNDLNEQSFVDGDDSTMLDDMSNVSSSRRKRKAVNSASLDYDIICHAAPAKARGRPREKAKKSNVKKNTTKLETPNTLNLPNNSNNNNSIQNTVFRPKQNVHTTFPTYPVLPNTSNSNTNHTNTTTMNHHHPNYHPNTNNKNSTPPTYPYPDYQTASTSHPSLASPPTTAHAHVPPPQTGNKSLQPTCVAATLVTQASLSGQPASLFRSAGFSTHITLSNIHLPHQKSSWSLLQQNPSENAPQQASMIRQPSVNTAAMNSSLFAQIPPRPQPAKYNIPSIHHSSILSDTSKQIRPTVFQTPNIHKTQGSQIYHASIYNAPPQEKSGIYDVSRAQVMKSVKNVFTTNYRILPYQDKTDLHDLEEEDEEEEEEENMKDEEEKDDKRNTKRARRRTRMVFTTRKKRAYFQERAKRLRDQRETERKYSQPKQT